MTEYLPPPEDKSPESPEIQFIDKLSGPSWEHFVSVMHETQNIIATCKPYDQSSYGIIDQCTTRLNHAFEGAYDNPICKVTGFARRADEEDGVSSNNEIFINTDNAIFMGIDILALEGVWSVIFAIHVPTPIDDIPSDTYYLQPDENHLAELQFTVQDEADILTDSKIMTELRTQLNRYAELSRDTINSPSFAERLPAGQRVTLLALAAQLTTEVMSDYEGCIVSIHCSDYYVAYDDMLVGDLADSYTDITALPEEEEYNLAGVIEQFGYPELDTLPLDQPITTEALRLNQGVACMVVYNEELRRRYYIPAQSIVSII